MDGLKALERIGKMKGLSPVERVLASTDGSVTQVLEAYLGKPVGIRTLSQRVGPAGSIAGELSVSKSDEVNFREVEIIDGEGRALIRAMSWTPLKRLEPGFRDDLMKADAPIGKLLLKHGIESRREILDVRLERGRIVRTYNIIRGGEVLMRVEEAILI